MNNLNTCAFCNKRIWFFQKNIYRLVGPDDIGKFIGRHFHEKCVREKK
ncbi:MAG: hypothetical protein K0S93_102 [Nitrososphaeraceae archaeon]|jgi:hypothetical protein|nr:hypothetical protein [Nitrososphaeraceae archaeon]MDF2790742.1 hypothetical protein [Neobacillus sp.]